jgi:hypothetical protein
MKPRAHRLPTLRLVGARSLVTGRWVRSKVLGQTAAGHAERRFATLHGVLSLELPFDVLDGQPDGVGSGHPDLMADQMLTVRPELDPQVNVELPPRWVSLDDDVGRRIGVMDQAPIQRL